RSSETPTTKRSFSWKPARFGWTSATALPADPRDETATTSKLGCSASHRSVSAPPYPLPPAIATRMRAVIERPSERLSPRRTRRARRKAGNKGNAGDPRQLLRRSPSVDSVSSVVNAVCRRGSKDEPLDDVRQLVRVVARVRRGDAQLLHRVAL